MTLRSITVLPLVLVWPAGCHCANADLVEIGSGTSSDSGSESSGSSSGSSGNTGEPFDASRWIGRYHYESYSLPLGERGDPQGSFMLLNFEILPDSTASLFYDDCSFDEPIVISYRWAPDDGGWLSLSPGPGESSLRYMAASDLEALRVRLIEPCRELRFESNGHEDGWVPFYPGDSCWVDRCTTGPIMQVDYCDGEQPEDACP